MLLCRAGHPVSTDALIEALWGAHAPPGARKALQVYVHRLRATLGADQRIGHGGAGYALAVQPGELDAHHFADLAGRGRDVRRRGDPDRASELLTQALRLWRGPAYADVDSAGPILAEEVRRLEEQRLQANEERIAADLDRGRHAELVPELVALTDTHPYGERLRAYLMLALYRAGRTAEALETFARTRSMLVEQLGVEPGTPLHRLHGAILRDADALARLPSDGIDRLGDGGRTEVRAAAPRRASAATAPHQLPPDVRGFVGRAGQIGELDEVLADWRANPGTLVAVISGMPGVGKTALAVHWAHRVMEEFPDGQLYVNLRGFGPGGAPVEPARALTGFLHALDVPPQRIPADPDEQAALYRSQLAGQRMLIVVDNARDSAQVRPLLPGTRGCLVVVTSRKQLTGLVATDGAHPVPLDLFTAAEARQLLASRLGPDRLTGEPGAVEDVISHCAGLPLALAIVAARAMIQPEVRLRLLAKGLSEASARLDALDTGDEASDIRAVFSWSYCTLTPDTARLFRLLGLHPGPDISAPAAASLAGLPRPSARQLLDEVVRAHLVIEHAPGRYSIHDLLRAYAAEQAHVTDTDDQRLAATHRMLDHYLHTAYAAARMLHPHADQVTLTPPAPATTPEHIPDHDQALDWFTAEHPVLLAAVDHAAATGQDIYTWQLARTLGTFLDRRGHWHDRLTVALAAVAAAGRLADPVGQARAHRNLAGTYIQLGRYDDAHLHLTNALDLATAAGNLTMQAHTRSSLGFLSERQRRHTDALEHARQALLLYEAAGHPVGQARALNQVGWYHALLADYEQAFTSCRRAVELFQELGDREGEAATWDSLGYVHHHLVHYTDAVTCYQHALDLFRQLGDRYYEAGTLTRLGETHHATGDAGAARIAWQSALAILTDLDHADAGQVRAKLRDLDALAPRPA